MCEEDWEMKGRREDAEEMEAGERKNSWSSKQIQSGPQLLPFYITSCSEVTLIL